MDALDLKYNLKDRLVGLTEIYKGDDINKYQVKSGKSHWRISFTQYMNNTINIVELLLKGEDRQLRNFKVYINQTLTNIYQPDLEQINEMGPELALCYLQLIGYLAGRWRSGVMTSSHRLR